MCTCTAALLPIRLDIVVNNAGYESRLATWEQWQPVSVETGG